MVIPVSTAICERGFSKQNLIKSHMRTRLKLVTLDALMRILCANILVENINWNVVMIVWKKHEGQKNPSSYKLNGNSKL